MYTRSVEKYIFEQTGIDVQIVNGNGYFYLWSNNEIVLSELVLKYSTSVYVNRLNQLTKEQWLDCFMDIWES